MKWVFWISAGFIGYVYFGYPLWIYSRARWRPRPWRREESVLCVSVVMAVHNEERLIKRKLDNLFGLDYPADRLEVIVVSDGSTDRTDTILAAYPAQRLKVVELSRHQGKAAALNAGIEQSSGEIVVFTDVRQELEPESLRFLTCNFADPGVGGVTGELVLCPDDPSGTQPGVRFYWGYEKAIRNWESQADSTVGATGALYAVRRKLLVTLLEGIILDDLYLPLQVVRQGYRSVFEPRARVWDSLPPTSGGEFRRKVRTLTGNYQLLQLAPWLWRRENRLRFQFISHKLLRLWVPLFLLLLLLSSWWLAGELFYRILALLQSVFYVFAVLGFAFRGKVMGRLLGVPAAFCLLNGAAVMGLIKFLFHRGPLWQLWVPANPRR